MHKALCPCYRQHLSFDDDMKKDYRNCSELYCTLQLCTIISTVSYEQLLQVTLGFRFRLTCLLLNVIYLVSLCQRVHYFFMLRFAYFLMVIMS